jgi:hypothetical protein
LLGAQPFTEIRHSRSMSREVMNPTPPDAAPS